MFCEAGAWKNFDDMEEELTLDELFLLYDQVSERQKRLLKTIAAAFGADVSEGSNSIGSQGDTVRIDQVRVNAAPTYSPPQDSPSPVPVSEPVAEVVSAGASVETRQTTDSFDSEPIIPSEIDSAAGIGYRRVHRDDF